jgi:hypothetical protein
METMTQQRPAARPGAIVGGILLIVIGLGALAARSLDIDLGRLGWPIWVIGPGIALLAMSVIIGGPGAVGMAIGGAVTTTVGLILAYQDATGHWESWAYAWALLAPGSIGLGLLLTGLVQRRPDLVRGGLGSAAAGVAIFLAGFVFFEGLVGISGRRFPLLDVTVPLVLVVLGAAFIVASAVGRRRA